MQNIEDLSGKVALVTGGSRGIGRAIGLALAQAGADVAVNFRSREEEARRVCSEIERLGRRAIAVRADVGEIAQAPRLIGAVEEGLGPVAVLVNNAGIARPCALEEISESVWDETFAVNLKSVFFLTRAALSGMRSAGWGRVINISSTAAQTGGIVGPHYTASKAGMLGLTRFFAAQLAGKGITVNAVAPALIETEMLSGSRARPQMIPVGRFGSVEEVAQVAVMLARNGYITGQTIQVNGGFYFS